MYSLESHGRRVEFNLRVFGHDYEIKLICPGARDQLREVSVAVSTEKGMNVDRAFVVCVITFC